MAEEKKEKAKRVRHTVSLEEKIKKAERRVAYYEENLESAKKKLQELKMKQESDKQKKAMELIMQSGKSWDEVIEMFK